MMKNLLFLLFLSWSGHSHASNAEWWYGWRHVNIFGIKDLTVEHMAMLILIIVFGIVLRFIVGFIVAKQLGAIFARLNFYYLEKLLKKLTAPLGNLAMAAIWAIFAAHLEINQTLLSILKISIHIFACLSFIMLAFRTIDVLSKYLTQKNTNKEALSHQLLPLFSRALKIVIVILGALFILQNLHIDVSSLLAGVTLGGLAFSFAAKDTVANIFGSITVFTDQSFKVGDFIRLGPVEGNVLSVGFRAARIKTPYNSIVTIPNSKFTDSIVDNLSMRGARKITTELRLNLDTTVEQIESLCEGIRGILHEHPATQKDNYLVYFSDYGESALKISIIFHLTTNDTQEEYMYRHEIFLAVKKLFAPLSIQLGYPSRTIYLQPDLLPKPSEPLDSGFHA